MFLLLTILLLLKQTDGLQNCSSLTECSECITTSSCVWCSTVGSAKCMSKDLEYYCIKEDIIEYESTISNVIKLPLNTENQLSIESINVELAVGQPLDISVKVKASEDFPLDLYMLMDLSNSFSDDLNTVKEIAPQLPLSLRNVSSLFHIGFGTFVDKPAPPFISGVQLYQTLTEPGGKPSSCDDELCTRPFTYQHVVNLTNSTGLFNSSVQETIISTNVDNPEDTLDAMLQAIVCTDVIGWREKSRKILLVMTDDVLHTAGDGALAGIVKPNDGLCHTEHNPSENKTMYTHSLLQDYPSMEQVKQLLSDKGIVPVFAIPRPAIPTIDSEMIAEYYNRTVSVILGGFAARLEEGSDNLIDVINEAYLTIVSNARLSFSLPPHLLINVTADCSSYKQESNECANIGNTTVNFTISLVLQECTQNFKDGGMETIQISVPGFGQFPIHIKGHCKCDCDFDLIEESVNCSSNGNETCGTCTCTKGWGGPDCSCSTAACAMGPNGIECSGRGTCQCGECVCNQPTATVLGVDNPQIGGSSCECSNYECDTNINGVVCSGRGTCMCTNGTYSCDCEVSSLTGMRHTGDACQCSLDHCINPNNVSSVTCSGRGVCRPCQVQTPCTCDSGYTGSYCQVMTQPLPPLACSYGDNVKSCVRCHSEAVKNNMEISETCVNLICNNFTILQQAPSNEYIITGASDTIQCTFIEGECLYIFYYGIASDGNRLYAVQPHQCLLIPSWAIALIILFILMILGIVILIIIKCCIKYLDYLEYKKFEKEVQNAMFSKNTNPIYQNPEVKYVNVAYGKPI